MLKNIRMFWVILQYAGAMVISLVVRNKQSCYGVILFSTAQTAARLGFLEIVFLTGFLHEP